MSYKVLDGEYETDESGLPIKISYIDELLQNVYLAMLCEREKFYPDKNFGSKLKGLDREPFEKYAEAYIRQALYSLDGVYLKKVVKNASALTAVFDINGEEKEVVLQIEENL